MIRRPPRSTRTDTLFPYTTLFRSLPAAGPVRRHASQRLTDRHRGPRAARAADRRAHDGDHARSRADAGDGTLGCGHAFRSEEHTSELQSLMRISYAVFCLKKKKRNKATISE